MQSARLKLIKPALNYVEEVTAAILESRPELERYLGWVPAALEDPVKNMQAAIDNHLNFTGELRYFVVDQESSKIVGTIGLIIRDIDVPFFEIGYWVRTSQVGKGYIGEAVSLLETYAFQVLKANRLEIRLAKCNSRSRAVAEQAGYRFEAELESERRLPDGEITNTLVFAKCRR